MQRNRLKRLRSDQMILIKPAQYRALALTLLLLAALIHPANSLAGGAVPTAQSKVSLNFDLQPLFDSFCVQCHLLESAQGGLVLENGEAWSNLVNVKSSQASMNRISATEPDQSYLLHKLRGTHLEVGGSGLPMPFASEASVGVSQEIIDLVERWIVEGAANN